MSTLTENKTATKRKYKVTPTPRQRNVARIMADVAMGKRPDIKNSGDIVVEAGYSPANKEQPKRLLNTTGVHDALNDLGFNEQTAKNVVYSILTNEKAKHGDRLKASDMVFKVHGTYAPDKHVNLNIDTTVDNERIIELANRLRNA
jgi:hypothetical protein